MNLSTLRKVSRLDSTPVKKGSKREQKKSHSMVTNPKNAFVKPFSNIHSLFQSLMKSSNQPSNLQKRNYSTSERYSRSTRKRTSVRSRRKRSKLAPKTLIYFVGTLICSRTSSKIKSPVCAKTSLLVKIQVLENTKVVTL